MNYYNSKVTMELRDLLKMTDENGSPFKLWDFDYPSFYEGDEKTAFEQKVIDHYLFHQIGCETPARFKHNFRTRIREIMPYYIQMYKSVKIMDELDDPFGNVDITESFTQTSNDTSSGTSTATSNADRTTTRNDDRTVDEDSTRRFSNTPQGKIENLDNYLTEAETNDHGQQENVTSTETDAASGDTSASSTTTNTGSVTHTLTRKGNQGVNTYAHDMLELRESFINVDMMVIGALRDLFLLIY